MSSGVVTAPFPSFKTEGLGLASLSSDKRDPSSGQLNLIQSFGRCVQGFELSRQILKSVIDRIRLVKDLQIFGADSTPTDESIEVDHIIPVLAAEKHNRHNLPWLGCLNQRHYFEELVHRSEAARKDHQRFGKIDEPEFTHEEIVKIEHEIARNVAVHGLFVRKLDIQTDAPAARKCGPAICRLHHSTRSAGTDDEVVMAGQRL